MYERPAYKTFIVPNKPNQRTIRTPSFPEANGPYVCPSCHNMDHPPGSRFCYVCGLGFSLSRQPKSTN